MNLYEYRGELFPEYLKHGNACQFIVPTALQFCQGKGLDVGAGKWPLPGATPVDLIYKVDAMYLPGQDWDFIFSSHCLEHLGDPIAALDAWRLKLRPGGVLFLYLPHPAMRYWLPQNCRKHRHSWEPKQMAEIVRDLGFVNVIHSERDLAWSFACVGWKPE